MRQPFQVLVYPYWPTANGIEYAIFRRADDGVWQTIAGGGEAGESPLDAARREATEEAGISSEAEYLQLDTIEPIPAVEFSIHASWGEGVFVIPQYCFGVRPFTKDICMSHEHVECDWFTFEQAMERVHYDGNRTALWELHCRLIGEKIPFPERSL